MEKSDQSFFKSKLFSFILSILVGVIIYVTPVPAGLEPPAWHLFAIFVATIIALITKPLPMGAVAIIAITMTTVTKTLTTGQALSGFSNTTIWLIVIAFFISRGFIKSGLGERIAYMFVGKFGKKTLGLSYALLFSDLCLSPAMPSNTARAGGIIYPIVQSLSNLFNSKSDDGTERRMGSYLMTVAFQGDMITSAMFMTAMAANPLAVSIAADVLGIEITWGGWMLAAIVPGLVSLILIPLLVYFVYPPEIKDTPEATEIAKKHLAKMGKVKKEEKYMMGVFVLLLTLWIAGSYISLDATATAFIGLGVLLLTNVLTWEDIKAEKNAWDTLVWFAALVMMASNLNTLGMIPWFSEIMSSAVSSFNWVIAFIVLTVVYLYSHYFFASATAHVSAMYGAFVVVMVGAGVPPMLAALMLGFFSNLYGCLTHYGSGPAPVFFGAGYVPQEKWWGIGLLASFAHILVWIIVGGLWWKLLGLW